MEHYDLRGCCIVDRVDRLIIEFRSWPVVRSIKKNKRGSRLVGSRATPLYRPGVDVRSYQCGELGDVNVDSKEGANTLSIACSEA